MGFLKRLFGGEDKSDSETDFGLSEETQALITGLRSDDYKIRDPANRELKKMAEDGDESIVRPLIQALRDGNDETREISANLLEIMARRGTFDPLVAALEDKVWQVRASAIKALGAIGGILALSSLFVNV